MNIDDLGREIGAFRTETKESLGKIHTKLDSHAERITRNEVELGHVASIQASCREDIKDKEIQTRGKVLDIITKILIGIILAAIGLAAGAAIVGCSTPETLKQSVSLTDQAVDYCVELTPDNSAIAKPLRDVKAGMGPVKLYIGAPERSVVYDPESDIAQMKAELAASEVRQQKMMQAFFQNFARDVLPGQLKSLVPASEGPLGGSNLELLITIIIGYFTGKTGIAGGKKLLGKMNGNKSK